MMAAQSFKALLRIAQGCTQRLARTIALFQMRHQPARAKLGDPGRVAGAGHQAVTQWRGAIDHHRFLAAMTESIFIRLGGIARQRQNFHYVQAHLRA